MITHHFSKEQTLKSMFAIAALAASLFAGLPAGQPFPAATFEDQFGKPHTVTAKDRIVMVSFERDVSSKVNAFLKAQPKGFLGAHHAKYIADISAMPALISRLFALPKMRSYRYPVLLNYDEAFEKRLDRQEGKLTLYRLQGGNVISADFIDADALARLFSR
jgi:hypothetical protein